jgi:hypothetical protein
MATLEWLPPRRLARSTADPTSFVTRQLLFDLAPTEDGCRLTVTERRDTSHPLRRLLSLRFRNSAMSLDLYLKALGAKLDAEPGGQTLDNPT